MFHHNWITRGLALCLLLGPLGPIYHLLTQAMAAISDGKPGSIFILLPVFLLLGFCLYILATDFCSEAPRHTGGRCICSFRKYRFCL